MNRLFHSDMAHSRRTEQGLYLALVALMIIMLIALAALVIGIGMISTDKSRFRSALNMASLAALEEFIRSGGIGDNAADLAANKTLARNRANAILAANTLPGIENALGDLNFGSAGDGGLIRFGQWVRDAGQGCETRSTNPVQPPCFIPRDGTDWNTLNSNPLVFINAIRIEGKTQSSNPLIAPITSIFGAQNFQLEQSVTASMVERCIALVLDASPSTIQETHNEYILPVFSPAAQLGELDRTASAANYGLFALVKDKLGLDSVTGLASCPPTIIELGNVEKVFWCDMQMKADRHDRSAAGDTDPTHHYLSDFGVGTDSTGDGFFDTFVPNVHNAPAPAYELVVDDYAQLTTAPKHYGAEPLSRYFLAFNVALRRLRQEGTGVDRAKLIVFGSGVDATNGQVPTSGLTGDLDLLIQLTNIANRGLSDGGTTLAAAHPNFLDKGWVPLRSAGQDAYRNTNPIAALEAAINALSDVNFCAPTSRKAIILATDGIATCPTTDPASCLFKYSSFQTAKTTLASTAQPPTGTTLEDLIEDGIALTVLLDGDHVQPNFYNIKRDGNWLDFKTAVRYGFSGMGSSPFVNSVNEPPPAAARPPWPPCSGASPDLEACAFKQAGQDGALFREPNGLWAEMAMRSGGIMCPLMERHPTAAYIDHDSNSETPEVIEDSARTEGDMQLYSVLNLTKQEQAAYCAVETIGLNPFVLVEEEGFAP